MDKTRSTQTGAQRYAMGWQPYRDVLARLILPRKFRQGDRRNMRRAAHVLAALHQTKYPKGTCKINNCWACKLRLRFKDKPDASK